MKSDKDTNKAGTRILCEWDHNEKRWSVKPSECHGLLQCMLGVTDLPLNQLTWVRGHLQLPQSPWSLIFQLS